MKTKGDTDSVVTSGNKELSKHDCVVEGRCEENAQIKTMGLLSKEL